MRVVTASFVTIGAIAAPQLQCRQPIDGLHKGLLMYIPACAHCPERTVSIVTAKSRRTVSSQGRGQVVFLLVIPVGMNETRSIGFSIFIRVCTDRYRSARQRILT